MRVARSLSQEHVSALKAEPSEVFCGQPLPKRLVDRLYLSGECWRVSGWASGNGYANVEVLGSTFKVHRLVYELVGGVIPPAHVLDHVRDRCFFRDCCRPDHLEPVTVKVNTHRGRAKLFKPRETSSCT